MTSPISIEDYIALQDEHFHHRLEQLRNIIRSEVPEAEELISYQIPSFKLHYMLVGFGVKKDAISLYTMNPDLVKSMQTELKSNGVKSSGSTIYLTDDELPEDLVRKVVRTRVEENVAKWRAKHK